MTTTKPHLKPVPVADGPVRQPFVSDAEREGLPVTNQRDTGAPVLDVDAVLRGALPDHVKDHKR
jgi:hypothetical protein